MLNLLLIMTYIGCVSSGSMLSMLLLLIAAYVSASIWLVVNGAIYSGLLYVLVYVGAIVVLIMFVVQLTNTSLTVQSTSLVNGNKSLVVLQNTVLVFSLCFLVITAYSLVGSELLFNMSCFNLDNSTHILNADYLSTVCNYVASSSAASNLVALASSIFNEYLYILILSVHAIVLAVIGPIKLALADYEQNP